MVKKQLIPLAERYQSNRGSNVSSRRGEGGNS